MSSNHFSDRIVKHLCVLMRMRKAASNMGDEDSFREYVSRVNGFLDALQMTLSGPYVAALVEQANARMKEEEA